MNEQERSPRDLAPLGGLNVHSIWDTIQGEGPFAGRPAVFVRLFGCNLQCGGCDTDYTSRNQRYEPQQLLEAIRNVSPIADRLIVLTGGEPFRQNIIPFLDLCKEQERSVQIETNGTLALLPVERPHTIVLSPKTASVHPAWMNRHGVYWKFILEHDKMDPADGLPTSSLGMNNPPARPDPQKVPSDCIYVQPFDSLNPETNARNTAAAVESCMRFGYTLSLQQHKYLNLA